MAKTDTTAARPDPPYRIETKRIVLRPWEPSDAEASIEAVEASREHLGRWLGWAREPQSLAAEVASMRRQRGNFDHNKKWAYGAFDPDTGAIIGLVGMWVGHQPHVAELGYWLAASATGRGLATEAVGAIVRVAIERLGFERVLIFTDPANESSLRLARRLGFREEGTMRDDFRHTDGVFSDSTIFSLLATEYPAIASSEKPARWFDGLGRKLTP